MKRWWLSWFHFSQPQEILESKCHTFKTKVFKQPVTCAVCNESIWNEGRNCKVCKYACHNKCEFKVATGCSPPVNYELPRSGDPSTYSSVKLQKQGSGPKRNSMSVQTETVPPITPPRGVESYIMESLDLDVDYITERIISMSFPAGGLESQYQANLKDVVQMLQRKHGNNYLFFNLSRRRRDINKLNMQVVDIGWPDHLAPPLEQLCSICKQIETWLKADPMHVVVIHCKGGRGPIGVVVSAYMGYLNFSNSTDTALDRYAMRRFLDAKTGSAMHPSQHRYIDYFSGLLARSIQINNSPLFLHYVFIHGVPNFDTEGGCRPFMRVYQNMQTVFTSGVYTVTEGTTRFAIPFDQALPLKGDILVKCYHKKFRSTTRDVIFRVQFHTTAIMEYRLVFQKSDLDDACTDPRFPSFTKVEFIFSATPDKIHNSDYVRGSAFPLENSNDPLIRWDSYEHFDSMIEGEDDLVDSNMNSQDVNSIPHLSAPDGSLYAQVRKSNAPKIEHVNNSASTPLMNGPIQMNGPIPNGVRPRSESPQTKLPVAAIKNMPFDSVTVVGPTYKEREELDELLKGFDDLLIGIDANETPDASNFVSVQKKISQTQKAEAAKPTSVQRAAPHISPTSPSRDSGYSRSSTELENPYAEIHDKDKQGNKNPTHTSAGQVHNLLYGEPVMRNNSNHHTSHMYNTEPSQVSPMVNGHTHIQPIPNGQVMPNGQLLTYGQGMTNGPVDEKIQADVQSTSYSANPGTHSPLRYNANERLANHGQDDKRHYRSSSPLPNTTVDSNVSANFSPIQEKQKQGSMPSSPTRINSYPRVNSPSSPIRAQKEIIKYVHTGPTSPANPSSPITERRQTPNPSPLNDLRPTVNPVSPTPSETSSEGSTDGLTWLQKQQLKLKQKRDRERLSQGSTSQPLYIDTMMSNKHSGHQHSTPSLQSLSPRSDSYNRVNEIGSRYTPPLLSPSSVKSTDTYMKHRSTDIHKDTPDPRVKNLPRISDPIIASHVTRQQYQPTPNRYQQYVPPPEAHSPPQRGLPNGSMSGSFIYESQPTSRPESEHSYVVDPNIVSRPPRSPRKERVYSNPVNEKRMHQIENLEALLDTLCVVRPLPPVDEPDARAEEPVQEPIIKQGIVASRVADARARIDELERSMSPPNLERHPRSLHRSNSGTGFEKGLSMRSRTPSPEIWIRNPGGQPHTETYFWNRVHGLKSPEIEAIREKERLMGYAPALESPGTPETPGFPLQPTTPYANMVSTPLAYVGGAPQDKDHNQHQHYSPQNYSQQQRTPSYPQHGTQKQVTPQHITTTQTTVLQRTTQSPAPEQHSSTLPHGTTDQGTPNHSSLHIRIPQHGTSYMGTPPQGGTPQQQTQYTGSPQHGTPLVGTPQHGTPLVGTPQHGTPLVGTPQQGTPLVGTLQHGTPLVGTQQQGTPLVGTPQHGTPLVGTPQHGTPLVGTPQQGTPLVGTPQQVSPQQGTLRHSTPQQYNTPQQYTPQGNSAFISPVKQHQEQATPNQYIIHHQQHSSPHQFTPQQNRPELYIQERDIQKSTPQHFTPKQYSPKITEQKPDMSPVKMYGPSSYPVAQQQVLHTRMSPTVQKQHSPEQKSVHFDIDDFYETTNLITNNQTNSPQISPGQEKVVRFADGNPKQDENRNERNMKDMAFVEADRKIIPTNQHLVEVQVHHSPPMRDQPSPMRDQSSPMADLLVDEPSPPQTKVTEMPHSLPFGVECTKPYPQYTLYNGGLNTTNNGQISPASSQDVSPTAPFASVEMPPKNYYPTFSDRLKSKASHRNAHHDKLPESERPRSVQGEAEMSGYRTVYDNRGKLQKQPGSPGSVRSASSVGESGRTTPSNFYLNEQPSLSSSQTSLAEPGVENVRFVKDLSSWWYKPNITRDDAIAMLKDKQPGTFVVRDSNSFPGAFGLAVKVATPPPNAPQQKKVGDPVCELVRHFLIEPNSRGVKLKGCQNEPVFGSLSALVYQHIMKQLALPCKLVLPESDPANVAGSTNDANSRANLLAKGAACNVLYLHSFDMESLTGSSAVSEASKRLMELQTKPPSVIVHFKVSSKGITVTDNNRKLFFRRHYPVESVLFCGSDSGSRRWLRDENSKEADARIFGFVSRKPGSLTDNVCHLFAEYEKEQPASAIVSFVTKVLIGQANNTSIKSP
ncbi:tensin-1-like isoform X3 [Antedon mediterranea]|uniref:tensin-1-like isoform X3 n=1 Tax=Antedon mediterranea TaxID=105859 RepID=UPI003AF760E9